VLILFMHKHICDHACHKHILTGQEMKDIMLALTHCDEFRHKQKDTLYGELFTH